MDKAFKYTYRKQPSQIFNITDNSPKLHIIYSSSEITPVNNTYYIVKESDNQEIVLSFSSEKPVKNITFVVINNSQATVYISNQKEMVDLRTEESIQVLYSTELDKYIPF